MKMTFTNNTNLSLLTSVWLAKNEYSDNANGRTNVISATTLLKPLRQIVLARQNMALSKIVDVSELIQSRMGSALHDSVEKAWTTDTATIHEIVSQFGVSQEVISRILINPEPEDILEDSITIYIEQRREKEVHLPSGNSYIISGAFDAVMDGRVFDIKSTSVWSHIFGSNDEKYLQQGSIYRWINPTLIHDDIMQIEHIFTDWSRVKAIQDSKYPQARILSKELPLMSVLDTDKFVTHKLSLIDKFLPLDQTALPLCTDEELWREADMWKYYKDPTKTARATKNFSTQHEANSQLMKDKNVGIVVHYPGGVKACRYCSVQQICSQYKHLKLSGQIKD